MDYQESGTTNYTSKRAKLRRTFTPNGGPTGSHEACRNKIEEGGLCRLKVEHNSHRRSQASHVCHEARVKVRLFFRLRFRRRVCSVGQ